MDPMSNSRILILFLMLCAACCYEKNDTSTLELVHILFRHGDRTPINPYPNDPYKDPVYWPMGWGQLTNEGKRRHYRLGQFLRERYSNFLNSSYNLDEIVVRSTDVDRTLMSAESNLAGLYLPIGDQIWANLTWQPIPVHTIPVSQDFLLSPESFCPRYNQMLIELDNLPEIKRFNEEHMELYRYLTEQSGKQVNNARDAEYIYDTLFIETRFNLTLPNWTDSVYPEPLKEVSDFSFGMKAYTNEMKKIRGGPLVREIREHIKMKIQGKLFPKKRRFFMYSAHDVTIAMFLQSLDIFNGIQPPYASLVMLELHKDELERHFVKIVYKNHTRETREMYTLILPGCRPLCPVDDFLRLTQGVVIDDYVEFCKTAPTPTPLFPALSKIEFIAVLVSGMLFVLLVVALIACLVAWGRLRAIRRRGYTPISEYGSAI
ncbi:prostatic acid phosphatase-like [Artemia franciscana]|uniref:acid phosphatase n=1 Tax=Artemia franciscana TaxID=6661 RepID=A0AA88LL67_ARTSF|nr:hypothetical protein QYM36_008232 [Artemia franciscana]